MLAPSFLRSFLFPLCLGLTFLCAGNAAAQTVRISNLSDITIPLWVNGDPDIIQDVFVCLYRQNAGGTIRTYSIKATGDGPGFLLKSGANTVAYTVTWNDGGAGNPGGGTTSPLTNNVTLAVRQNARVQSDAPANSTDCNAGSSPTGRLRVTVTNTNLDAARDGIFNGVLTLILSPT